MPQRWLHELLDIIAHGWSKWKYHKWKDEPSRDLGKYHRVLRHDDWIKIRKRLKEVGIQVRTDNPFDFLRSISFSNLPKNLELDDETWVGLDHEVIDWVWSSLSEEDKRGWTRAFRYVILLDFSK